MTPPDSSTDKEDVRSRLLRSTDKSRLTTILFGKPLFRDRDEKEVRGSRQTLSLFHEQSTNLPLSEEAILSLHRLTRGEIWDAGKYKDKNG